MTKSVALCTYNGEKYLKEQLDSILSQEIPVDEIVICDDCSTDETISILKEYETQFPNIFRVFINAENLGYVRNFEKALSFCTGEIIFLCDQDDLWRKDKTQKILQFFSKNPKIGVVAHDLELIGNLEGGKSFWDLKNFNKLESKKSNEDLLSFILFEGNVFPGMSLAIRREILQNYLPLQKIDSIIIHDYEIIIKALHDKKFGFIEEKLSNYRQHENQSIGFREKKPTKKNIAEFHLLSQHYLRVKKYIEVFNLNQKIAHDFQNEINLKYSVFLKQFPFFKRKFIHLKNKYYYKIIHF